MTERLAALCHILSRDPAGRERQPTERDYDLHESWARERYGAAVWTTYVEGGWAPQPEV